MVNAQRNVPFNSAELIKKPAITASPQDTIKHVRSLVTNKPKLGSINYIYVLNKQNALVGVLSVGELFQAESEQLVGKIMQRELVTVRPTTNPERAAYLTLKNSIKAIPVVDKNGIFLGIIENDDILEILYHEFRRDLSRMSGTIPDYRSFKSVDQTPLWQSLRSRLPWIAIGLLGGAFIAHLLTIFEYILLTEVLFVPFIPLVVYIANAVGIQTQTMYIRDESQDPKINNRRFLIRQLLEGLGIGIFTWISLALLTTFLWNSTNLGFIVGMAMTASILVSVIQAVSIPAILVKLKKDPVIGSGPFATILQDFSSVAIYIFIVAKFV